MINSVSVLPPKNMQILYQDSAAFPTMKQRRTCQNFKIGYISVFINLPQGENNRAAWPCRNTRDPQLLKNTGLQAPL